FWNQLVEADLTGLLIAEEHGGSGMGVLEGAIVAEEFGRSPVPSPWFVSSVLAAGAIHRAGTDAQRAAWLPRIANGDAVVSVAWLEPDNGFSSAGVQVRGVTDGDDLVISGRKRHVFFASAAERLVTLVRT